MKPHTCGICQQDDLIRPPSLDSRTLSLILGNRARLLGISMKSSVLRSPASILLSLVLLGFAIPYVCDVGFCEEVGGTRSLQVALIDGEPLDPSEEGDTLFASLDGGTTADLRLVLSSRGFTIPLAFHTRCVKCPSLPTSGSRPPPLAR